MPSCAGLRAEWRRRRRGRVGRAFPRCAEQRPRRLRRLRRRRRRWRRRRRRGRRRRSAGPIRARLAPQRVAMCCAALQPRHRPPPRRSRPSRATAKRWSWRVRPNRLCTVPSTTAGGSGERRTLPAIACGASPHIGPCFRPRLWIAQDPPKPRVWRSAASTSAAGTGLTTPAAFAPRPAARSTEPLFRAMCQ